METSLQYLPFLLLSFLGIFLCLIFLFIAQFLGPKLANKAKKLPFESGLESQGVGAKNQITISLDASIENKEVLKQALAKSVEWSGIAKKSKSRYYKKPRLFR